MTIRNLIKSRAVSLIRAKQRNQKGEMCYYVYTATGKIVDVIENVIGNLEICKAHIDHNGRPTLMRIPLSDNQLA